jgi:hypothetical protein
MLTIPIAVSMSTEMPMRCFSPVASSIWSSLVATRCTSPGDDVRRAYCLV